MLQYDVGGLDVSAAYGLNTPSAVMHATVFVYPIPGPGGAGVSRRTDAGEQAAHCRQEFDARKWQLARAHPGSRIIHEGITEITQGTVTAKGEYAIIGYDGMWQGRSAHLAARLYVFCPVGETWILKYRFTHRDLLDADQAIDGFLRTWSGATNGPRQPR